MPRAQSLELRAPGKRRRVEDESTSSSGRSLRKTMFAAALMVLCNSSSSSSSSEDSEQDDTIQSLELRVPGKHQRVEEVGTSSSGRSLRKTMLPRRFCNSSSSSSEDSEHDGAEEFCKSGAGKVEKRCEDMNAPSADLDIFKTRPSLRGLSIEGQRSTRLGWLVANKILTAEDAICASDQDIERVWRRPDMRQRRPRIDMRQKQRYRSRPQNQSLQQNHCAC
jgi:hypothetical protein